MPISYPISIFLIISHLCFFAKVLPLPLGESECQAEPSHRVLDPGAGQGAVFKENSCSISIISTIYNLVSACVLGSQIMGACTHKTQPPRTHATRTLGDNRFPSPRTARVFLYTTGGSNKTILVLFWTNIKDSLKMKKCKTEKIGMKGIKSKVHDEDRL